MLSTSLSSGCLSEPYRLMRLNDDNMCDDDAVVVSVDMDVSDDYVDTSLHGAFCDYDVDGDDDNDDDDDSDNDDVNLRNM